MPNTDTPFGFRPIKHLNGSEYNGQVNQYAIGTGEAAMFVGDLVYLNGTANADGVPTITRAPAGVQDTLLGAIVSFPADRDNQNLRSHPASTAGLALVCDGPDTIFECQATTVAVTDFSNIADIVATAGSTLTGNSAMEVDGATYGTGAQVRVLRLHKIEDNVVGDNAVVEVILNQSQFNSQAAI